MDMKVGHCLTPVLSVVYDETEPPVGRANPKVPGDVSRRQKKVPEGFLVGLVSFANAGNDFLRNDQDVGRGLGIDILEGDADFIFVNDVGRDFPGDDFLEDRHCTREPRARLLLHGQIEDRVGEFAKRPKLVEACFDLTLELFARG